MKMYLLTKESVRKDIDEVESFEAASLMVVEHDLAFEEWQKENPPQDNPFPPILKYWEGCDIFLKDDEGQTWMYTDLGWQEYFQVRKKFKIPS